MFLDLIDKDQLWQWDTGVLATVNTDANEVHFANLRYGDGFSVAVKGGKVLIPSEVLQSGADVYCYAYVWKDEAGYTIKEQQFEVTKRAKPDGYAYTPAEVRTWVELEKRIKVLENSEESDPTVPDWAKQPEKPKYTAEEVGAVSAENEVKYASGSYIGNGNFVSCKDFELEAKADYANKLEFPFVPMNLNVYGDKACCFRFEDTGDRYLPNTDNSHIRTITPVIDGSIEDAWGEPQKVTNMTNGLKPVVSTWVAFDDKNIYYAYRCEISSATFGTGLKAIVFVDKANDGTVGSEQGTGSNHDRIGWWYYANESTGRGQWQDYDKSWSAPYLRKNDREMMSYVKKVNNKYIFEGELRIARSTAPYIDEAISSGKVGQIPIRIGFVNNGVEYWSASVPGAVIPEESQFKRELKYRAYSVEEGVSGRAELANRLFVDKESGKCTFLWAVKTGEDLSAENQLNTDGQRYNYTAWGVDAETLYKQKGW